MDRSVAPLWAAVLTEYQDHLRASGASEGTIRVRMHHAGRFTRIAAQPRNVTPAALTAVIGRVGLKPESRKSLRSSARRFFSWCYDTGVIDQDPSRGLPPVRVPQGHPRPAPEQIVVRAVIDADQRTRAMIMLAAYAGLRCCEICAVHSDDLSDQIRVHGKGGKVRAVPLHPVIIDVLPHRRGFLFPGKVDGHLAANSVTRLISHALPEGWTAHTLRHRFATAAYAADRDLLAVQQLLGHSSTETTRRYTAIPDDALVRAVTAAGPKLSEVA